MGQIVQRRTTRRLDTAVYRQVRSTLPSISPLIVYRDTLCSGISFTKLRALKRSKACLSSTYVSFFPLYSCQCIQAHRCTSRPSSGLHASNCGSQRSVRTPHSYTDIAYIHIFNTRTTIRKGFASVKDFIEEPDSRAQCMALEENVKEFGLTYFGMKDRRQGVFIWLCEKPH